jgi:hypothetical protein
MTKMADKISLNNMLDFLEWGIEYHGKEARKIERMGYTENTHAEYEEMFEAIAEQIYRLKGLEK